MIDIDVKEKISRIRKIKIIMLVVLCFLTVGLCGIFVYGMMGNNLWFWARDGRKEGNLFKSPQLVLEQEIPLNGIEQISVLYNMNSNDIHIYEKEGSSLSVKEYSELALKEDEVSTVVVTGSSLEIKGKKRNIRGAVGIGPFYIGPVRSYTEIGLPSAYKGQLSFATSSGDISSEMDFVLEKDFKASTSSGNITMPNILATNVNLGCSSGDVAINNINTQFNDTSGEIVIKTTSGNIDADQLIGAADIESSSGDIKIKELTGGTKIKSNSGYIDSEIILGDTQITTSSGDIGVQRIDGIANVNSSSGNVKIYAGSGVRNVRTNSGDILLEGVDSAWNIQASSGSVQIKATTGSGDINTTSGDVNLDLEGLTGDLHINSSSGWAKIKISNDNSFDFEASTSSGDINTFFDKDLNFNERRNSANGVYGSNQDQRRIVVRTTSGDVEVTGYRLTR